ncbi:MAG: hypothetical protein OSJ76_00060 [Alphaproteobacteria bacterium]|nr:hypothetical protein [Alphaproteobacteria bacterium]
MSFLKSKTAIKAGEFIGRDIMKKVSDFTNELETWTSKNPLNAKTANYPNEDEYMREHNRKKKNASTYSNEANIENIPPQCNEMYLHGVRKIWMKLCKVRNINMMI